MASGLLGTIRQSPELFRRLLSGDTRDPRAEREAITAAGLQMLVGGSTPVPQGTQSPFLPIAQGVQAGQAAAAAAEKRTSQEQMNATIQQAMQAGQLDRAGLNRLFMQALASGNMETAQQLMEAIKAIPADQGLMNVPAGGAVFDPSTGTELYSRPTEGPELPADLRAVLWSMGIDDRTLSPEQRQNAIQRYEQMKRAGATTVAISPERETNNALLDITSKQLDKVYESATAAEGKLRSLQVMQGLLDAGTVTGPVEEFLLPARQALVNLGIATPERAAKLGQQEMLNALGNRFALEARTGGGVNLLPGQMSDKDVALMKSTVARLGNTPQGNRLMIAAQIMSAENDMALAEEADRYVTEHGSMGGWLAHRRKWGQEHPVTAADVLARAGLTPEGGTMTDRFEFLRGGGR